MESYADMFRRYAEDEAERERAELVQSAVRPLWRTYGSASARAGSGGGSSSSGTSSSSGWKNLAALRKTLAFFDRCGYNRSVQQRQFHEAFIRATIRVIFRDDFEPNALDIMRENGWDDIRQEVLIVTPRRFGKTFSVGLFTAAFLWTQPRAEVCIFSTGRRASRKLLALIRKFLGHIDGSDRRVVKYNVEELHIRGDAGPDDVRTLASYPSKVRLFSFRARGPKCRVGGVPDQAIGSGKFPASVGRPGNSKVGRGRL